MSGSETGVTRVADYADRYRTEVLPRFLDAIDPDADPDAVADALR